MDKGDLSDSLLLNVIKRPKMYQKIEATASSSRQMMAIEALVDHPQPRFDRETVNRRDQTSKSCPRPFSIERAPSKYVKLTQTAVRPNRAKQESDSSENQK